MATFLGPTWSFSCSSLWPPPPLFPQERGLHLPWMVFWGCIDQGLPKGDHFWPPVWEIIYWLPPLSYLTVELQYFLLARNLFDVVFPGKSRSLGLGGTGFPGACSWYWSTKWIVSKYIVDTNHILRMLVILRGSNKHIENNHINDVIFPYRLWIFEEMFWYMLCGDNGSLLQVFDWKHNSKKFPLNICTC